MERKPLLVGTIVEFCDERGAVVEDYGGDRLTVNVGDYNVEWWWRFEGEECKIISTPTTVKDIMDILKDYPEHTAFEISVDAVNRDEPFRRWFGTDLEGHIVQNSTLTLLMSGYDNDDIEGSDEKG